MRSFYLAIGLCVAIMAAVPARRAPASEPYVEFLHALQDQGYPDIAIEYIDQMEKERGLPPRVRMVLDLERCNSYRAWAQFAFDPKQADARMAEAQKYLDKFLKEHADTPEAGDAMSSWGDLSLERGQQLLGMARGTKDAEKKAKCLTDARAALEDAGKRLEDAKKRFKAQLAKMPKPTRTRGATQSRADRERQGVELGLLDARFKAILVTYFTAQTYAKEKDPDRVALLKKAAKDFDEIYQEFRNNTNDVCLLAHLWQGRCLEDLGDMRTALDVYDEVLGGAPDIAKDKNAGDAEAAPLFAQAALFRLRAVAKSGKPESFLNDALLWMQRHRSWRKLPAYQGIALEVAKAQIALAQKSSGEAKNKLLQQAAAALAAIAKIETEYKHEALLLRHELVKTTGRGTATADEYMALGHSALANGELGQAEENYSEALNLATEAKDQKHITEAQQALNRVRYQGIVTLYQSGKVEDALKGAAKMAQGNRDDPSVAGAACLYLMGSLALYADAKGKGNKDDAEKCEQRVNKIASFVAEKWPGRPEADDARMALGQICNLKNDPEGAMKLFNQVKPESKRYPTACFILGQMHWKAYLEERRKEEARNAERMKTSLDKAEEYFTACVTLLKRDLLAEDKAAKAAEKDGKSGEKDNKSADVRPAQMAEASLLLGQIYLEKKDFAKAAAQLDPMVEKIKETKPKAIDSSTFRAFVAAVRAHMAQGDTKKSAEIALLLVQLAEDNSQVNSTLVNFTKLLGQELKKAEAAVTEAKDGSIKALDEARAKRDAVQELMKKILEPLCKRKEQSLGDLVYLGDISGLLGMTDLARSQYEQVLTKAKDDPEFAKTAEKAIIRVQSQLIGLLRNEGKYEEAAKQADQLIEKKPNALEPRMVKAYILEDWARKDPKKYEAAVGQWTDIRLLLGRMTKKPPEYYEVIYKTSELLMREYATTKDVNKLNQSEQLLRSPLTTNSKLSGPDMVAKYNDLLKKIANERKKLNKDK